MAHPYELYVSTRTPKPWDVRLIAPSHYLVRATRADEFLVKRIFINDGNGPPKHYWQTTKVLQRCNPFVESEVLNLSSTKREALDWLGAPRR